MLRKGLEGGWWYPKILRQSYERGGGGGGPRPILREILGALKNRKNQKKKPHGKIANNSRQ